MRTISQKAQQALLWLIVLMGYATNLRSRHGLRSGSGYSSRQDVLGRDGGAGPLFALDFEPSLANLPRTFALDGETPTTRLFYVADGAGGFAAETGLALAETGSGASTTDAGDMHPLFGAGDHASATSAGGKLWATATASPAITTGDFIVELVLRAPSSAAAEYFSIFSCLDGSSRGISAYYLASLKRFTVSLNDGTASTTVSSLSSAFIPGCYYHVIVVGDRSGNQRVFINGASNNYGSIAAANRTLDFSGVLAMLASGAALTDAAIMQFGLWEGSSTWLSTDNQAAFVADRFARLNGTYATKANGSAVPTTATRASAKYIRKDDSSGNSIHVPVGANWSDVCRIWDGTQLLTGYRGENAATNLVPYSDDISHADWAKSAAAVAADGTSVFGRTRYEITGDGTTAAHHVTDAVTLANATRYVASACFEAGTDGYGYLQIDTDGTVGVVVNLSTGAVHAAIGAPEATGASVDASGIVRAWVRDTANGAAARDVSVGISSDGSVSSDSAGTIFCHGGIQVEAGSYPTSPIYTSGGSATRAIDTLAYSATGNYDASGIRVDCDVVSTIDTSAASPLGLIYNIGNAAFTAIVRGRVTTGGVYECQVYSGGKVADVTGTTGIDDGDHHTTKAVVKTDNCTIEVDGASEGTPDTSMALPGAMTHIYLSTDFVASVPHVNSLAISSFKIYKA